MLTTEPLGYIFNEGEVARRADSLTLILTSPTSFEWTAIEKRAIKDRYGNTHTAEEVLRVIKGAVSSADLANPIALLNPDNGAPIGQSITHAVGLMGIRAVQKMIMLRKSPEEKFASSVTGEHCRWPYETIISYSEPQVAKLDINEYRTVVQADGQLWRRRIPTQTCSGMLLKSDFDVILPLTALTTDQPIGQSMKIQVVMLYLMALVRAGQLAADEEEAAQGGGDPA